MHVEGEKQISPLRACGAPVEMTKLGVLPVEMARDFSVFPRFIDT
jgi:hypothetical protein